jgi:hypothetical protein
MSGFGTGEVFPSWEQLLSGVGAPALGGSAHHPRHVRPWLGDQLGDDGMSWAEAAGWSGVAVSFALVAGRWVAHLLG